MLAPPFTPASLRSTVGVSDEAVLEALREWERLGVSGPAGAAWLRSLEEAASGVVPASLVWTGHETKGLHSRDTRQVLDEMISSAKRSILLSSYTYFDGPKAFRPVAKRMDSTPGLRVTLLLNIERGKRSTTKSEDLGPKVRDQVLGIRLAGQEAAESLLRSAFSRTRRPAGGAPRESRNRGRGKPFS